jgi:hypothetical protein
MPSAPQFGSYNPSDEDAKRYWDAEASRVTPDVDIPEGFPKRLESTLAWRGEEIADDQSSWKLELTKDEIAEIDAALSSFEGEFALNRKESTLTLAAQHESLSSISTTTFPLPDSLVSRLRNVSAKIYGDGVGFHILHGLLPSRYTQRQNVIVFAGLSAHVCPQRGFVDNGCEDVVSKLQHDLSLYFSR